MTAGHIELRMLGPLEARIDGAAVPLGGPTQRALVALLLLNANDVVPLDVLIEQLWAGRKLPRSAPAYVQNCVSRLRKEIGADTLETRAPGYRLRLDPDAIDARRFERLVREASTMPARERAAALREALELWRGTPLSDLAYWSFAQDAIRNLEEHRVNAVQMRLEAELELGLHREAIGELDGLVREHPTHERLRWLQMLALHRSDRRQDALAAYQEARLAIVEESGMEPGEELRALQRRILQDDPTLMPGGRAEEVVERAPHLARKVVAVCIVELLVDEDLDVEAARGLVARGLASLEEIVIRHGGTVEQLLGEEALAVFGVPAAHEDDVLRALRSVVELRDASAIPIRAAVEAGEVLVGDDGRVLSGAALTTARRVKEAAGEGEILLGPSVATLTAGAAWTEPVEGGHRLVELVEGAPAIAQRPDVPLVGRRSELERLVVDVRETAASSSCRRIVVLGEPGIGKTRLAAELVRTLDGEALVVTGRCVRYAEGATYLPLVRLVEQIVGGAESGPALIALLEEEPDGERAATRLDDALSGAAAVDSGDVFWATRKLLERVAQEQPLLVVLEDLHWAEPTFLDLLEYLVGWSTGAPIALVCLARPELLDTRPAWAADTMALRPITDAETAELLEALPESLALDVGAREAVIRVAEGNPLFLEQLAAHALDGSAASGGIPASLESLLASRLDSLPTVERAVLERAAIVGREFTRAAVDALAPDATRGSATTLLALVRRRLIRPDTARAPDDAFLFDHALIRDAAYAAVAKAERARLHEQLADWLGERGELDEIVGHHLEQAVHLANELGEADATLVLRASETLAEAGLRALKGLDASPAVGLLTRAVELLPSDGQRLRLECELGTAIKFTGDAPRAEAVLEAVADAAARSGDRATELRAQVELAYPRFARGESVASTMLGLVEEAIPLFEARDDSFSTARAWHVASWIHGNLGRMGDSATAAAGAAEAYRLCGASPERAAILAAAGACHGPMPVPRALRLCETLTDDVLSPGWRSFLLPFVATLDSMEGRFDAARASLETARRGRREFMDPATIDSNWAHLAAAVELRASDPAAAEAILAPACDALRRSGDVVWLSMNESLLAEAACRQGRIDEALRLAADAIDLASRDDVIAFGLTHRVHAAVLARAERFDEAKVAARDAVEALGPTDLLDDRGHAFLDHAGVLSLAGDPDAAVVELRRAIDCFEAKGNTVAVARAARLLEALA
jgi:DNA-binding SARP family transcriptional activator